jgi:uncharacterized membrane protein
MKEWLIFALFFAVGLAMLVAGIVYTRKEKNDAESVKIYRIISIIGGVLTAGSIIFKFMV